MSEDNRTLGDLIPVGQLPATAQESETVAKVAERMRDGNGESDYSQMPLRNQANLVRYVATWKSIALGLIDKKESKAVVDFSEMAHQFDKDTPVDEIVETVASFGYVLVMDGEELVGIVTYTDVMMGKYNTDSQGNRT